MGNRLKELTRSRIPQLCCLIAASGHDLLAIRAEGDAKDLFFMIQADGRLPCAYIPQLSVAGFSTVRLASRHYDVPFRTECQSANIQGPVRSFRWMLEQTDGFSCAYIPQPSGIIVVATR